jgi:hypothetical protein
MKAYKAIIRHGKLYDLESNKRIFIKENGKLIIAIDESQLLKEDPYNKPLKMVTEDENLEYEKALRKKHFSVKLIASTSDELKFTIKAGKNTETSNYAMQCTFRVKLLGNLYMLQKHKENEYGLVSPCPCIVDFDYGSELKNFEQIYAYSLNDAYSKTYEYYFSLYGKSTINIYNNFYLIKEAKEKLLAQLRMFEHHK